MKNRPFKVRKWKTNLTVTLVSGTKQLLLLQFNTLGLLTLSSQVQLTHKASLK